MSTVIEQATRSMLEHDIERKGGRFFYREVELTVTQMDGQVAITEWLSYSSTVVSPADAGSAAIRLVAQAIAEYEDPGDPHPARLAALDNWHLGDCQVARLPSTTGRAFPHFVVPVSGPAVEWLGTVSREIVIEVMEFFSKDFTRERATEIAIRHGLNRFTALEVGGYLMRWKRYNTFFARVPLVFQPGEYAMIANAGEWIVAHIDGAPGPLILCHAGLIPAGYRIRRFIVWWLTTGNGPVPHATVELRRGEPPKQRPDHIDDGVWLAILDVILDSPDRFGVRRWRTGELVQLVRVASGGTVPECARVVRAAIKQKQDKGGKRWNS